MCLKPQHSVLRMFIIIITAVILLINILTGKIALWILLNISKLCIDSSPISLGCRSMLLRQPKLEEKMLSICRSSMLSAVSAC